MVELFFQLQQDEDGWPPVAVEGLWCQSLDDGHFRVETCPLFVKNVSVGDVITVQHDEQGEIVSHTLVTPSENSTLWIIFWNDGGVEPTLQKLRSLGCDTATLEGYEPKLCSVNVASSIAMPDVDAVLAPLEEAKQIAVAYPSFRHDDGG